MWHLFGKPFLAAFLAYLRFFYTCCFTGKDFSHPWHPHCTLLPSEGQYTFNSFYPSAIKIIYSSNVLSWASYAIKSELLLLFITASVFIYLFIYYCHFYIFSFFTHSVFSVSHCFNVYTDHTISLYCCAMTKKALNWIELSWQDSATLEVLYVR